MKNSMEFLKKLKIELPYEAAIPLEYYSTVKRKRLSPFLFIERKKYYSALKSKRLLRVPWRARKSNQSILKEFNPEYSLEGLMLKLKLQYFGHLMQRANSFGKDPDVGKD